MIYNFLFKKMDYCALYRYLGQTDNYPCELSKKKYIYTQIPVCREGRFHGNVCYNTYFILQI